MLDSCALSCGQCTSLGVHGDTNGAATQPQVQPGFRGKAEDDDKGGMPIGAIIGGVAGALIVVSIAVYVLKTRKATAVVPAAPGGGAPGGVEMAS